ncbi:OmpA family protein [Solirubrum puertoriconensis]|uniref:OmpA family protein n=1 Tax=Solirubrum puertoriconensis TaxID=1751427 RepID=UPI00098F658B|nr:OmpA family protein [Solirubrum puertoriconensis]
MSIRTSILTFGALLGISSAATAQHAVWASKVVEVSSQKSEGKEPFSPDKVLGEPDALPLGQISDNGWIPKKEGPKEFIEVKFAKSVVARQVTVVENFNPGSIIKIELVDTRNERHQVYENPSPGPLPEVFRTLQVTFSPGTYRTIGVVVTLNTAKVNGVNQIDAIGVADVTDVMVKKDFRAAPTESISFDSAMVNLGPTVNTKFTEVRPVIAPDGRTLFFARQGSPQNNGGARDPQDVWYSTLSNAKTKAWSQAKNIGTPINTAWGNGVASVSADGNTAVLISIYKPDGTFDPKGASITRRTRNGWTAPEKLNIQDFYNDDPENVDFFLTTSGKQLLMAVDRKDGKGQQDLYVSLRQDDGSFSRPINLGSNVNTKAAEFAPFLAADGKTLYFASEGLKGYGKSDIFYSKRLDNSWTNWSKPRNLGPSINSPAADAYFTLSAAGDEAYLVSDRNGTDESRDIFRISLTPKNKPEVVALVRGRVLDAVTRKPVTATVRYENLITGEEIGVVETNPTDGSYTIVLPAGAHYGYRADAKGYLSEDQNLDVTDRQKYSEQTQDLFLIPFQVGQTIRLNNIFFAQSKYYLRENSYPELMRLVRIMKDYPQMEIRVDGHTDNQGDPALNMKLSIDRVNEVKKYLVSKGIPGNRITTQGFGDTKPIASNEQEETRKMNRRVEFVITKK